MKILATLVLMAVLALPAAAAVVHDEAVDGDLSTNPAAPTPLAFALGSNVVKGSVRASTDTQDFITFTVPAGTRLLALNLLLYAPNNIGFMAFNAGTTSFIPSVATDPMFLSGIHVSASETGTDLMPLFVTNNVTSNALPDPWLDPGAYCFVVQQANTTLTSYQLEFVLEGVVPVRGPTWGAIKQLFR
jgi:hypothetical protein